MLRLFFLKITVGYFGTRALLRRLCAPRARAIILSVVPEFKIFNGEILRRRITMTDIADRAKDRLEMAETDEDFGGLKSAYLEVFLNDATQIGKVMDLSEHGLRVRLNLDPQEIPDPGNLLHNVNLGTALSRQELPRVIIRRVNPREDGQVDIGLEGEDRNPCLTMVGLARAAKRQRGRSLYD